MRVKIRNFQSLKSVDLDLTGFTVITGPSNIGKSAVVRAIQAALFGAGGDYFIMDKPNREEQCAVSVIADQDTVKWWKVRSGSATPMMGTSLEVNGTKYTRFGREQAELTKKIGFVELEVANLPRIRPQIASQHDQIFLISGSDTEAAETLKLLGRVDVVTEAQRLSAKDAKEQAQKLKIRKEDQDTANAEVNSLEWVIKAKEWFEGLQISWSIIAQTQRRRERLCWLISETSKIRIKSVPAPMEHLTTPNFALLTKVREAASIRIRQVPRRVSECGVPFNKFTLIGKISELVSANKMYYETMLARQNADNDLSMMLSVRLVMEKELGKCPLCERSFNKDAAN